MLVQMLFPSKHAPLGSILQKSLLGAQKGKTAVGPVWTNAMGMLDKCGFALPAQPHSSPTAPQCWPTLEYFLGLHTLVET